MRRTRAKTDTNVVPTLADESDEGTTGDQRPESSGDKSTGSGDASSSSSDSGSDGSDSSESDSEWSDTDSDTDVDEAADGKAAANAEPVKKKKLRRYACYLVEGDRPGPGKPRPTYVGCAVNPSRRLKQHNGELSNGAKRTKRMNGSAKFVCIVEPFRDRRTALQFEAAWQKKQGGKKARGVQQRLRKLRDRLAEERWTKKSMFAHRHGRLNIHWFRTPPNDADKWTTHVGGGLAHIRNATVKSVQQSMYPDGFKR